MDFFNFGKGKNKQAVMEKPELKSKDIDGNVELSNQAVQEDLEEPVVSEQIHESSDVNSQPDILILSNSEENNVHSEEVNPETLILKPTEDELTEKLNTSDINPELKSTREPIIVSPELNQALQEDTDSEDILTIEKLPFETIINEKDIQHYVDILTAEVSAGFQQIDGKILQLLKEFTDKLKYDKHKDNIIDNMHKELQGYKNNSQVERIMPIMMDLILSIDLTTKLMKGLEKLEEIEPEKLKKVITDSVLDLEDILLKQGIESFECDGKSFDSKRQKVVKKVTTSDLSLDKKISERLAKGYEMDGKIIRKEQISVFVFEETK